MLLWKVPFLCISMSWENDTKFRTKTDIFWWALGSEWNVILCSVAFINFPSIEANGSCGSACVLRVGLHTVPIFIVEVARTRKTKRRTETFNDTGKIPMSHKETSLKGPSLELGGRFFCHLRSLLRSEYLKTTRVDAWRRSLSTVRWSFLTIYPFCFCWWFVHWWLMINYNHLFYIGIPICTVSAQPDVWYS